MHDQLRAPLERLCRREDLEVGAMRGVIASMMQGHFTEVEIAAFLTALRVKGESVSEIVGAAEVLQELATPILTSRVGLLDTCGTGGDELHTFNISTAAAFVLASMGIPVPKHGNRGVSSTSGSADVLEALGVNIQLSPEQVGRCLNEIGIGFCFAPLFHGAMKHAAPVRKQLRFRTVFNLVGPLINPARAEHQLIGASRPDVAAKLAQALAKLGRRRALVVCGAGHLDEVSLWGETQVFEVAAGGIRERTWSAASFGLPECRPEELRVGSAEQSADVLCSIFAGDSGPCRNIVLANSAAGLLACEMETDLPAGVARAATAIDSGATRRLLDHLIRLTGELARS